MIYLRQHTTAMAVVIVYLLLLTPTAAATGFDPTGVYGTLEAGRSYTWGLDTQIELPLQAGQIITEAVLTVHNIRVPSRVGRRTTPDELPCPTEIVNLYVLDNPRFGLQAVGEKVLGYDVFVPFGAHIAGYVQARNLIYRLSQTDDPNSWAASAFGENLFVELVDKTSARMSTALLEFIDYAGTGVGVGFGIHVGQVRYNYDDITLRLTVKSYKGVHPTKILYYHGGSMLEVIAANGNVDITPSPPIDSGVRAVTLSAISDQQHTFQQWSGSISDTDETITINLDSNKTITAHFSDSKRSLQRGDSQ